MKRADLKRIYIRVSVMKHHTFFNGASERALLIRVHSLIVYEIIFQIIEDQMETRRLTMKERKIYANKYTRSHTPNLECVYKECFRPISS